MAIKSFQSEVVSSPAVSIGDVIDDTPELTPLLATYPGLLIYTESSPHFQDVRLVFNHEVTAIPRAIIRPRSEDELTATVALCAENNYPMSVRSGGHDASGRSTISNGVVVDVRAFAEVKIAADGNTPYAIVGAGVQSGNLLRTLDENELVTPVGWCDEVGYIGWAAGGGYGSFVGYYGMGADQILGGRVVTSSGSIIDTDDDPELLWALRGAGLGNFGVVLELRVKVYPRPAVLAGLLAYPFAEAQSVLGSFEKLCEEDLPASFSGEAMVANLGAGNSVVFSYHWILDDNMDEAMAHLGKMKALGTLVLDTVAETTPYKFIDSIAPSLRVSVSGNIQSVATAAISPELVDVLIKNPPNHSCTVVFHHGHGQAATPNPDAAFAIRKRHIILGISGAVPLGADDESKREAFDWSTSVNLAIRERGLALDQGYWSFTPPEFCDAVAFFGEEGVRRMCKVKERYNPRNAFPLAYPTLSNISEA